jgi:type III secretion protein S
MLTNNDVLSLATQSLSLVLSGSLPVIITAAVAGIAVSLLQALTQIQDQGLPTAVKFFAVIFILFVTYTSMASSIAAYTITIFNYIAKV